MKDLTVKIKKGEKAYVFIPAHIKKPAKQLAAKRKMTLSKLVATLVNLQ
jgi:hypothetical protein